MPDAPLPDLWPLPKETTPGKGTLAIGLSPRSGSPTACIVTDQTQSYAAEVLGARLNAPVSSAEKPGCVPVRLRIDPALDLPEHLRPEQRPEAYRLSVTSKGIQIAALEHEGLLRGAATALQLLRDEGDCAKAPFVTITDWPNFRRRCASDWLLNAEINRWAYDWGDGIDAYIARVERKLDMCFAHKINMVWFDGLGWDVSRFDGYADLLRHLNAYARRRGIRLLSAGYGGGYGTSYQKSELYRYGQQGRTFFNRRPYPDGPEYDCCGATGVPESRKYGTCPSNEDLQADKLSEMARFVSEVQPGFMYIHDIDSGTLAESQDAWGMRCNECRRRWPCDDIASPQGQAGAMAAWFRKVRDALSALPQTGDYNPETDLTLVFISPLYTNYYEPEGQGVWEREVEYFCALSSALGQVSNVEFGLREQFLSPSGEARIAQLRQALDEIGNGHGAHVVSFGGGDCYITDDLANMSGALAHMFEGAQSVCLSNGAVHEEPVQLINADFLWSGTARGYAERTRDPAEARAIFEDIAQGRLRPPDIFREGGVLQQACRRLWGEQAGDLMYRAHTSGADGATGPVAKVWWAITREVRRLRGDPVGHGWTWESLQDHWTSRLEATRRALEYARQAQGVSDDPDIVWFVRCLEVGQRFAQAVALAMQLRVSDSPDTRASLISALDGLEAFIDAEFDLQPVDILGGDPGCWLETAQLLREASGAG